MIDEHQPRRPAERAGRADRDTVSRIFGALADPTRRAMLERLTDGPASVSELAEPMPMSLAAVSKHLGVLEDAGLVSRGRSAQYRPAKLEIAALATATAWLDRLHALDRLHTLDRHDLALWFSGPTLTVQRAIHHPPPLVWSAWTQPAVFAQWFGTEAVTIPVESVVLEPVRGGELRATMLLPDGTAKHWEGVFVQVFEPSILVFTLTDEPGSDPGEPIVVRIQPENGGGSTLTLQQSTDGFDDEGIAALEAGYGAFFDSMERVLNDAVAGALPA